MLTFIMGKLATAFKRVSIASATALTGIYAYDQLFNNKVISRTCYAYYKTIVIASDYKLNFKEGKDIAALHERNALRLYNLITRNKGLYIKIGQSIAIQGGMLPAPYRTLLSKLYDDAPQDTWEQCENTLASELGNDLGRVFSHIDPNAVASASIAQVHKAKLLTGEDVAVKIQHEDIEHSAKWDLGTYKLLMWTFDRFVFKMPMYFIGKYIADQVLLETDFRIEMQNANIMRKLVTNDNELGDKVYIPKVYEAYSGKRVMVMEWIDGVSLSKIDEVRAEKYDINRTLSSVFKVLTKEAFEWGVVHCDPHPGNWILRRKNGKEQLVMLDHGLYVFLNENLRTEYAKLWYAMFKRDMNEITRITQKWGFGDPKMFASATMIQKFDGTEKRNFEDDKRDAERFRSFLKDTEKIPLELIFVGRTQRILQGLNVMYGSPVNRINILVEEAFKVAKPEYTNDILPIRIIKRVFNWCYKETIMSASTLFHYFVRFLYFFMRDSPDENFEETMQKGGITLFNG